MNHILIFLIIRKVATMVNRSAIALGMILSVATFGQQKNVAKHSSADKKKFVVHGTVRGIVSGTAILKYVTGETPQEVNNAIVKGKFNFSGRLNEPQEVTIEIKDNADYNNSFKFFAQNAAITINADTTKLESPIVYGSPVHNEFISYQRMVMPVEVKSTELRNNARDLVKAGRMTESVMDSLLKIQDELRNEKKLIITNFTKSHPASAVSAWAISNNFFFDPNPEELEPLYRSLSANNRAGLYGKVISEGITKAKKTSVGKAAIDFTQPDATGKSIELSSNKGKYLLVDFWASWCGPCRVGNPTLVKVYNQYKDKGFDILGVSLDGNSEAWQKAVKADRLTWTQVSDLKGWNNTAAIAYGIKSIPFNLLLDKDGIIIGKNLRGADLENKLKEIFKN
jgi:thiol-disulfide isomerase/thioredoxin